MLKLGRRPLAAAGPGGWVPLTGSRGFAGSGVRRIPRIPLWIDGRQVQESSGGSLVLKHSKTREESCELVIAGPKETEQAIQASWRAFESWRDVSGWERRKVLSKVLSLLQERLPEFRSTLLADAAFSDILIGADQASAMNVTDGAADTAISVEGYVPPVLDGSLAIVLRKPYGPVLSIPAFNFPLTLALRSIVYPIACGNTVILKTPILLPQLPNALSRLFHDAGLPNGVLQVLNFSEENVQEGVNQMIAHPAIRLVNFTGSTLVGRKIAVECAKHLKPSVLELGGKSAAIVLASADLKLAANNILFGGLVNSGQVCMSTERILVDQSITAEFEKELKEAAAVLDAKKDGFELVRATGVEGVKDMLQDATSQGARIVYPSSSSSSSTSSSSAHGAVVLADVPPAARISTEEAFGPILTVSTFSSLTDALAQVHSLPLGLSTAVFGSLDDALPLAQQIESGAVHINSMTIHDEHTLPFGGVKESGWGRFNGRGAIESFTWKKNITMGKRRMLPIQAL